jgi:membrane protease subunit HflK
MWANILEILSDSWSALTPFFTIPQYEKGVILRLGKYLRTVEPGPHWKMPFVDTWLSVEAVQTTMHVQKQTLATRDGVSVTTSAVLQYEIKDPKLFLLEVYEGIDAINDIALSEIKDVITNHTWEQIRLESEILEKEIVKKIRRQVRAYGVHIKRFGFADIGKIKTIRLMNDAYSE